MVILKPSFITLCLSWIFLTLSTISTADETGSLAGDAFSDPSKQIEMPEEWIKKPITYKEWAKDADLAVSLDQQLYPAFVPIIEQYGKDHNIKIGLQEGTCGTSAKAINDKAADIAGFCCPAAESDRLPGIKFHTMGIGALALIVNKENPIDNITFEQAQDIFQGKIFRWSDIKVDGKSVGSRKSIQVLGRLHCKQRTGHWRLLLDNEDLFSPRMFEVSAIKDMISEVAGNDNAIGYETLWMAFTNFKDSEDRVKALSINGISPMDNEKLASGEYPLYRTFHVTTWETDDKNKYAQGLVDHLMENLSKVDPAFGFVPVSALRKAGWQFKDAELIGEPSK